MVLTNFVHFPKCRGHILAGYLVWLAIYFWKVPLNCFTQCLQQCKMCNAITNMTRDHQEGLMSKG